MNNNMVSSLQNIKNDIQRKKIFKPMSFALPSNLPKTDLDVVKKDLSQNINIEKVELQKYINSKDNDIQSYTSTLRRLKQEKENYQKRLEKFNDKETEQDIDKYFKKILGSLPIEHIEFRAPAVTIFTTSIFKKRNKIMGAYRIWIDWNYKEHGRAIRVLNVHHESDHHSHPCVGSDGALCEGNASPVLRKYFGEKDIYNLVETIISFILSDDVSHGYITTWDRFFDHLIDVDPETIFSRRSISPRTI